MQLSIYRRLRNWYYRFRLRRSPQMNVVWGFFLYTMVGFVLLSAPLFHKVPVGFLDNLFIATSAISTTGLVTVSVFDSYNFFGQLIVMLLFQIGGIGYMTLTTYFLLLTTNRMTRWHRDVVGASFTLPETIRINDFIKSVILFTIVMETMGAIAFYIGFTQSGMLGWKAVWFSVFHSVSAFCTAGFGLFNDSFEAYRDNTLINVVISVLAISGSLGFIVITDLWYRLSGRSKALTFTTKIVIYGFLILLSTGTLIVYLADPMVREKPDTALLQSFFQSMTAMTTVGFNTLPTGALSLPVLLMVTFLMYVGASPSGTAGGLKITTLTAMISVLKSRLIGEKKITFMQRTIPFERLYVATSTFMLYTSLIFFFTFLLSFTEPGVSLDRLLFEVASALGTVGLSMGITGTLSGIGKIMVILLMFIGRVGVLTFGFALLERKQEASTELLKGDLAV